MLNELSEKELKSMVLSSALSYGFESDLWTVGRLHQVITEKFCVHVSNGGRKRVNINGAVNIMTLETVTDFTKSVNKEYSLRLCRKIEKKHPKAKKIHLWLDNASDYVAKWLKEPLKGSKIVLHFLPGYSPNLNLIERWWKFFKKEILYNSYHETFEDFLSACKNFFRCRTKYKAVLSSLHTEKFHLYKNQ